jgi:Flp pilus assembly protein TadD
MLRSYKFASLACACALVLNVAAVRASSGDAATNLAAPSFNLPSSSEPAIFDSLKADDACADGARNDVINDAANDATDGATKKHGNTFVRIITAPLRALASLFGGGKKDARRSDTASDTATKGEPTPAHVAPTATAMTAPTATTATTTGTNAAATIAPSQASPSASQSPAASTQMMQTPVTVAHPPATLAAAAGASLLRAPQANAPFTPLVVGVPRDSISQGRALIEQGYLDEAISELSVAAATGSNLLEANNLLGLAHDRRGLHKQAQGFYERALTVAPNDPHVLNNLGYSLYLDDRPKDALAKLKLAARLSPTSPEIYNNLGFVYGRLNKFDEAFRNFARAGGDFYARVQTGSLLEAAGRDRDAIRHYEAARRLEPASTELLRRLITLYNRTGQRDKAEAAERALDRPQKTTASTSG